MRTFKHTHAHTCSHKQTHTHRNTHIHTTKWVTGVRRLLTISLRKPQYQAERRQWSEGGHRVEVWVGGEGVEGVREGCVVF